MSARGLAGAALLALAAGGAAPLRAEVVASSEAGFVSRHAAEVPASPAEVWNVLVSPGNWWNGEHTYSGNPLNLSLDPRPGGCFCEVLPSKASPRAAPRGGVEHMRVVYAEEGRALRLVGGLGPLQPEAVQAVLTITLKPLDTGGTRIQWEYVVGGYMRFKPEQIGPLVDKVLAEQVQRLARNLGARPAAPAPEPLPAPAPVERDNNAPGR